MTQARLDSRCPLCGRYLSPGRGLAGHIPDCDERENTLDELEERSRSIRQGEHVNQSGVGAEPGERSERSPRRSGGGVP